MSPAAPSTLIIHSTPHSTHHIVEALKKIFLSLEVTLFSVIDHSEEAYKAGLKLPNEQLLIFGDPKIGTLLMQENPSIGIELPLKILVWQDENGITQIAYRDPAALIDLYHIKKNAEILQKMGSSLAKLVATIKQ